MDISPWLVAADLAVAVTAIGYVLRNPREPRAMLAWILAFILMPVIGVLLFFLIGEPKLRRIRRRRQRRRRGLPVQGLTHEQECAAIRDDAALPPIVRRLASLATGIGHRPPVRGNRVTLFHEGHASIDALEQAIREARHHCHLEYYIFAVDSTGGRIAKALMDQARAGVKCRLLVDFVGSWTWEWGFFQRMREAGVEVALFLPMIPWRGRWRVNFRNHRKIAIIDGTIGFTGSQNIGDLYAGVDHTYGEWHDTHLRIEGPAVQELQDVFVEDWHYAARAEILGAEYFPSKRCLTGDAVVQIAPSGPDLDARVVQVLILTLCAAAEREICIATPYFVPDSAIILALQTAAYRGIRVRLLVPQRTDHRLTLWATRSYYREMCAAGVEVCEYQGGMLHSKVVVVDGAWGMVGSANMDERSFRLNFELSVLLYDPALAAELLVTFDRLQAQSRVLTDPNRIHWGFGESLLLGLARLAAPML